MDKRLACAEPLWQMPARTHTKYRHIVPSGGCWRAGTVSGGVLWHARVGLQLGRLLSPAELMDLLAWEPTLQDPPSEEQSQQVGGWVRRGRSGGGCRREYSRSI